MPDRQRANHLLVSLTSFVGREREVAEVRQLLGMCRLVTLSGAGGVGKTRLALRIGADLTAAYPDGVRLADGRHRAGSCRARTLLAVN